MWDYLEALCQIKEQLAEGGAALHNCFNSTKLRPSSHVRPALPTSV